MTRPDHQDAAPPLPGEDQQVTIVSVQDGQISVLPAKVLVARPQKLVLELEAPTLETQRWSNEQVFTILYSRDDLILRLRAQLTERVDESRLAVIPLGPAREGDRRDFRRADLDVQLYARVFDTKDAGVAREAQLAEAVEVDHPGFRLCSVNISGSGISFSMPGPVENDSIIDVRLVMPSQTGRVISFIGTPVRVGPEDSQGERHVALRFCQFSEAHQDAIIYAVFSHCFAQSPIGEDIVDYDPFGED